MSAQVLRGTLCVAPTHACLAGHFPGRPLVPAVLLLDALAGLLETRGQRMLGLSEAKFLAPLLPGEHAALEIVAIDAAQWRFHIIRADTLIARGRVRVAPA
ncbi:MAG: hydroxymyristoyl-ACP dehydratase [Metallibacterium scheffleri]|jgi:3-hydroxymyristoyl/3-hydroxydecanoyl-(acyl carrier protein) dehydratase